MSQHIEILVEELSAEELLRGIVPKMVGDLSFAIRTFEGKMDLLKKLPDRLKAYAQWIGDNDTRLVVLIDEDRQDCAQLKIQLESMALDAGLRTKTASGDASNFDVLTRVAVEELEAWYFGDCEALRAAYPRVPKSLEARASYRLSDAITGGTWERLEMVLQKAGYHRGGLAKVSLAREMAKYMEPSRNTSPSFQAFHSGMRVVAGL